MFSTDQETYEALNCLTTATQDQTRPLVIWIGAGISTWAGYSLWQDLAAKMHTTFSRTQHGYDRHLTSKLLKEAKYPELFEQMRLANQPRYFTILAEHFCPKSSNGVYSRFIKALRRFSTVHIVTTNVDEALEHNLPELVTIQKSDIERLPQLLYQRTSFVCKLHGSVSSVDTMVFSTMDYTAIKDCEQYLNAVRSLFSNATVLFLGYSLRDEYVLRTLQESSTERPLFGTGPHFIVTSEERIELPATVRRIRYVSEVSDHRDALQTLEAIADFSVSQTVQTVHENVSSTTVNKSLYFIASLFSPGTSGTSQTLLVESQSGPVHQMIVGEGFVNGEVKTSGYSALHDIVVGLICFDIVCVSIDHLGLVHHLLGSEAFWILVRSHSLRLIIPPAEPSIVFLDEQTSIGGLTAINVGSRVSTIESIVSMSISERIHKQLSPIPGKENEAEDLFQFLESTIFDVSKPKLSESLPEKTHGALMHPSIRRMLGVSMGTPRNVIPRWLAFPILRLAQVIRCGFICQHIKANATRMIFGSEKLASVAFSSTTGKEWADDAASYVLTGKFNSDIGSIIAREPSLLLNILRFRDSSAAEGFRREVALRLAADDGGQIITAINAGLHEALPTYVLQQARDQLSGLFMPRNPPSVLTPAVWGDLRNSDESIAGWRRRSRIILETELKRQKLGPYDNCLCGSGEKLKFCCQAALT